jgi:hypothetical protein
MNMEDNNNQSKNWMKHILLLPKLFLIITVVLVMWIIIILSGPLVGVLETNWAGLSPSLWMISISIFIGVFIIIDIILYATPYFFITQSSNLVSMDPVEFPEVEYRKGKQVYEFTYPVGSKGGIFSKTYILIDNNNILRIRNQMIKNEDAWKNQR